MLAGEFVDDGLLYFAKTLFTLALKILADRATQLLLYRLIGIKKRELQAPGELPANCRFSRAG